MLKIKRLVDGPASPPSRETPGAAGLDLSAVSFGPERAATCTLAPGARTVAWTGFAIELPRGHVGLVCPRSGLAVKHGVTVVNAPGVVDEDYRGEVGVPLVNLGAEPFALERGMRVAQLVVVPYVAPEVVEVAELGATQRGGSGFGSTGEGSTRAGRGV